MAHKVGQVVHERFSRSNTPQTSTPSVDSAHNAHYLDGAGWTGGEEGND